MGSALTQAANSVGGVLGVRNRTCPGRDQARQRVRHLFAATNKRQRTNHIDGVPMATLTDTHVGHIIQVIGSTFDAQFEEGHLPEIYNALKIDTDYKGV